MKSSLAISGLLFGTGRQDSDVYGIKQCRRHNPISAGVIGQSYCAIGG